ncbi:MAG: prenyltransferase [Dehalococcoidia bacterium]|nr:prenyltransferase [Dehalococcoidia bacterium]
MAITKTKAKAWIQVQKIPRHSSDVFSLVLGSVIAWYHVGQFNWLVFIASLLAVFCIANGIYLTNEAQDYEGDKLNKERIGAGGGMNLTSTGGSQVLVAGHLKRKHVQLVGMLFFVAAIPLGLLVQFGGHTGWLTIPLGALGILVTYSYSNPPVKASYRGLGETFMMLGYAMLLFTAYYIHAGLIDWWIPMLVAMPRILTVPALKIIRNFPDAVADAASGKRTSVVIFGKERMRWVYIVLIVGAVLSFAFVVIETKSFFSVINLWPAVLFIQSIIPVLNGQWKERAGIVCACKKGFQGLLLTPVTLTFTLLLSAWIKV